MQTYELGGTLVGIKKMYKADVPEVLDIGAKRGQFNGSLGATTGEQYAAIDAYIERGLAYVAMVKGSVHGFLLGGVVGDKVIIDYLSAQMKEMEKLLVAAVKN